MDFLFKKIDKIYEEKDFKIVKTTIKTLLAEYKIENYSKNRKPDDIRINFLENFFKVNNINIVPQIISTWNCDYNRKLFIYDGSHRFFAAKKLYENKSINMIILVKIFTTGDEKKIIEDFKNINSAICVPWLYMEENNEIKKMVCESVVKKLMYKFKDNISSSRNCQKQNFNRDNIIDILSNLNIDFYKQNIDNTIYTILLNLNLLAKDHVKQNNIPYNKKCEKTQFWLMYLSNDAIANNIEELLQ